MKRIIIILTVLAIFLISLLRIVPVVYEGYPPSAMYENLILARNLAAHGEYKIENNKNVILASSLINSSGIPSTVGNKLTPILYSQIYKLFGFSQSLASYVAVLFFALSSIVLFLIVLRLFGYWPAVIFSVFEIFMPAVWKGVVMAGFYEFASFSFAMGLLLYLWHFDDVFSINKNKKVIFLLVAGIFFSLAIVLRNAFIFSVLPILVYEFIKNKSYQRWLALILPFFIVVGGFLVADWTRGEVNTYLTKKPDSFLTYGHLFPDPYTYYFDRENYLVSIKDNSDPDISEFALKYGYKISVKNYFLMYLNSLGFYIRQLFNPFIFGGPIFVLVMVLGAVSLYREKKNVFEFFMFYWLPLWYVSLVAARTNNWDHFLEISLPMILMMALGVWRIIQYILQKFLNKEKVGYFFSVLLIVVFFMQILISDRWMFHEFYGSSSLVKYPVLIERVRQAILTDKDVLAVGIGSGVPELLNYYTDKNYVYFAPETIKGLLKEGKLKNAFERFGVTKFLGYSEDLSVAIKENSGSEEIIVK